MALRSIARVARPVAARQVVSARHMASIPNSTGTSVKAAHMALLAGIAGAGAMTVAVASPTQSSAKWTYDDVKQAIIKTIEAEDERRDNGTSLAPTFVRLAWHCAGTFSKVDGSGGSDGCRMRYNPEAGWGANAGLATARASLDPLQQQFPGLTCADLYTYAGAVAVEHMGGPTVAWRPGRKDMPDGTTSPPDGRLPNADMGSDPATAQHLRDIFYRMGFNDQEIVALSGAHALGRCHEDASGYWGPWTRAESTFSNEYFRLLKEETWTPKKTHHKGKCPWKGPQQFEDPSGELMMLPSDIVLTKDAAFDQWVVKYAANEDLFFKDFAGAFSKLLELGVKFPGSGSSSASSSPGLLGQIKKLVGL